jgi:hypothetical protein
VYFVTRQGSFSGSSRMVQQFVIHEILCAPMNFAVPSGGIQCL